MKEIFHFIPIILSGSTGLPEMISKKKKIGGTSYSYTEYWALRMPEYASCMSPLGSLDEQPHFQFDR